MGRSPERGARRVLVAVITAGLTTAAVRGVRAVRATSAFRRTMRRSVVALPGVVRRAVHRAGLTGRVTGVEDGQPLAVTYGLLRPRVLVSTGLLAEAAELDAVLVHEREHVRRRDPLKALLVRVLTGRLFFLPLLGELGERFAAAVSWRRTGARSRYVGGGRWPGPC
ncbi:M56 family metallopeptidase [Streptomyces lydicus]|uniref:M56 family metallopeptidase n=1 Tax=Streptomyces lydicus TaxID=47763 RepID=UPI0037A488E3